MNPIKTKQITEKSILIVPLFLAFIWMGYLVLNMQSTETGLNLAPSRLDGLINSLFGFIIVYAVVLAFLFYRMNKEMKKSEDIVTKKVTKKKTKKKK
jgi:ATP/ADP translocase